ncbi:MAG TPA: hypothetical protein GX745_08210 [Clostridiales bacterium]|nr:hypothetical protein [Clostridiales bacterium]
MAIINDGLSTYHLSTGANRAYQPAKGNFFEFIIDDIPQLLKAGVEAEFAEADDYITNAQEVIRLTVNRASIPHFELADISIRKGNSVVYYAGVPTFSEQTIELDDMIGAQSKAVLEALKARAYDISTDKGGRAIDYKFNANLVEYTSDHVKVRGWKLIGCWIRSLQESDYNKEEDSLRRVSASVRCDRAIPEYY